MDDTKFVLCNLSNEEYKKIISEGKEVYFNIEGLEIFINPLLVKSHYDYFYQELDKFLPPIGIFLFFLKVSVSGIDIVSLEETKDKLKEEFFEIPFRGFYPGRVFEI